MTKLLLLEDEAITRAVLKHSLTKAGYSVVALGEGCSGIAELINDGFDAVVTDLQMPRLGGSEVIKLIRKMNEHMASVPIIVVSGDINEQSCATYLKLGANVCLPKPVDNAALLDALSQVLESKAQQTS